MERIKNLTRYQQVLLIILVALPLVFLIVYFAVTSRTGYLYREEIFVPHEEGGSTVYTGTVEGVSCRFAVTADKTVTFYFGETVYGPYTAKEDPTAIPDDHSMSGSMTGIEILENGAVFFRGGVVDLNMDGQTWYFVEETGESPHEIVFTDGEANRFYPTVYDIWELMNGPELVSKGFWFIWFFATLIAAVTAVSILFADEIFRWHMAFRIRDVQNAEPSDWELAGRNIAWTVLPVMILIVYIMGLQ